MTNSRANRQLSPKDKKGMEKDILNLVYSDDSFDSINPAEEPDFRLRRKSEKAPFGVEITEFYFSESRARVKNIPGYVSSILNKEEYRHKDDRAILQVKDLKLIPADDTREEQQIKGIIQEQPKVEQYVSDVARRISSKNKKFKQYRSGLDHVNLVLFDCEERLMGVPLDRFYFFFFKPDLEKTVTNSEFREIFFITRIGPFGATKHVYIPLKMLFLVAEVYRFNFIVVNNYSRETKNYSKKDEARLLAEYLLWRGAKSVSYKILEEGYEVAYGNSSIAITDKKVEIFDHNDFEFSKGFQVVTEIKNSFFDVNFKRIFNKTLKSHIFTAAIGFDVKKKKSD